MNADAGDLGDLGDGLLVLAALIGVMLLLLPFLRRRGYAAKTLRGVGSYRWPSRVDGLPAGIVATAAASAGLALIGADDAVPVAVPLGILTGVLARSGGRAADVGFSIAGVVGIVATVATMLGGAGCSDVPVPLTLLALAGGGGTALVGAAIAGLVGRRRRVPALEIFAVVDVLLFVVAPLGVPLVTDAGGVVIAAVVAVLFGAAAALAPAVVIGLGAIGVSVGVAVASARWGTTCSSAPDVASLLALLACAAAYLIAGALVRQTR